MTKMKNNSENCPYCGEPIQKGFISIGGNNVVVEWLANPKKGRIRTKWETQERISHSFLHHKRYGLRCERCNVIIFDSRDPDKSDSSPSSSASPWTHQFSMRKKMSIPYMIQSDSKPTMSQAKLHIARLSEIKVVKHRGIYMSQLSQRSYSRRSKDPTRCQVPILRWQNPIQGTPSSCQTC